ncbi:hypothetical protein AB4455_20760 [Vibrio sp. 10N.261.46.E12]|uniref:hypothetical protein n=1 Tax=unclassified Vibrio TaxID=2614977 RepID=UPI000978AC2B|nr:MULTISPECIES: hypothetical protein [unclassified Vibrio]OMO35021.1 hypothetical protein BH584_10845 [Vibrio sp. 10N.261.45.E1]PMJ28576.1 hypothetical protein BCU27_04995 [Vibrio sp. 10N.286.45.B6]PML98615.1 hypothetical protein BCT66_01845 [Vibrio sp. 10N.261.49.E11]PMM68158.1 hypothetical protein BCT48_11915 [Vibrio sp. 10N.261.46.F12]PMM82964.1 hypothetical protein BCT46_12965 [Vibrio sp. 10N.261.46.E8]
MISSAHNDELNRYIEKLDLNLTKAQVRELGWLQSDQDAKKDKAVLGSWFFFAFFGLCTSACLALLVYLS